MGFDSFYETWLDQIHRLVDQLRQARRPPPTEEDQHNLRQLVQKVVDHHAEYFRVKSVAASHDVLHVFASPWVTSLERSLHWIGGWRPPTAFHLLYTESSILFESRIIDILNGIRTGDLGDLSPAQFRCVSELQCDTVRQENTITDELFDWQDESSDLMGICVNVDGKIQRLVGILEKADELRLGTIREVVDLLTPHQAAEFLIAATELQFGVRGWGFNHDRPLGDS